MSAAASTARCTVGPLAYAIPASQFEDWLAVAPAGARIVYAHGLALPRASASVIAARVEEAAGRVTLTAKLAERDGVRAWEWIATRLRSAAPPTPPPSIDGPCGESRASARPRAGEDPDCGDAPVLDDILRQFRRAANMGLVAPTNAELARAHGLPNAERARYLVGKLIRAKAIAVEDRGPRQRRIVTLLANGRSTKAGVL